MPIRAERNKASTSEKAFLNRKNGPAAKSIAERGDEDASSAHLKGSRVGMVKISRHILELNDEVTLGRDTFQERFISVRAEGHDELSVFSAFPPKSGLITAQLAFGGNGFHEAARKRMSGAEWPMMWIQGDVCPGTHVTGTQAFALDNASVSRIRLEGRVVGSTWSDADADYCLLAGMLPTDLTASRGRQTQDNFEQIETVLHQVGMDFSHVVRTWFYLDNLLDWYGEFNAARDSFFHSRGVFDALVPASTGIGGSNPAGAALASGVLAIRPRGSQVKVQEIISPLQCSAIDYRSSFSRAVEVGFSDRRMLMVSGTASIAPDGASLHAGDTAKQIHLTLDVVEAILKSRGMDWKDTVRAIGYFFDIADLPVFDACCEERGIAKLPLIAAHATVCRADLLFEIELDAIVPTLL